MKARSGNALRCFKSDGNGIFTGSQAQKIYASFSIRHIQSAPGDSASNDIAERTIRTLAELTCTNLVHSGAPPNLWAEAMGMVAHVWNNLAVCPDPSDPGNFLSRTALLEGHKRKYDLDLLRAFGTKCHFMLTLEKKGGRKQALLPKAQLGAIVGIEDNMPAFRVYDFEKRGVIRRIPFAQIITHEGHFPFKDLSKWSDEEKLLPASFIPSLDARNDAQEWARYQFSDAELQELDAEAPFEWSDLGTPMIGPCRTMESLCTVMSMFWPPRRMPRTFKMRIRARMTLEQHDLALWTSSGPRRTLGSPRRT